MELDRRSAPRTPPTSTSTSTSMVSRTSASPGDLDDRHAGAAGARARRDLACYAVEIGLPGVDEVDPEAATPPAGEVAEEDESAEAKSGDDGDGDGDGQTRRGRLWLCATPIWQEGRYQALAFVGHSALDRLRLADLMAELRGPAVAMRAGAGDAFVGEA
ncbi:MAG: hypothetical protein WKG00_32075 [Polyangiaceae bacterium]